PTLATIAGADAESGGDQRDGVDLAPLLRDPEATIERDLFWHYPHYHAGGDGPYSAIRSGNWRFIEFHEDSSVALHDVRRDIGETTNLAADRSDVVDDLRSRLHAWRERV